MTILYYLAAVATGAVAGLGFCLALARWQRANVTTLLCLSLVYIAAIYVGPTVGNFAPGALFDATMSLVFFGVAAAALRGNRWLLAAGYFGHGALDAVHGPVLEAMLPNWYAPMCLGFDWAVAVWILIALDRCAPQAAQASDAPTRSP
jgi:hypothetical protein